LLDFYYVNDDRKVDLRNPQVMRCLLCYNSLVHTFNPNTKKTKKWFITYYKTPGIIALKKHVDYDHATIVKTFNEKVNALISGPIER
jgi:hypothetical protein